MEDKKRYITEKRKAYELLAQGFIGKAEELFQELLNENLTDKEIECALKLISIWKNRENKILESKNKKDIQKIPEELISAYKNLLGNVFVQDCMKYPTLMQAMKEYIYNRAIGFYEEILKEGIEEYEVAVKTAIAYKEIGKLENALNILLKLWKKNRKDSFLLSLIADIYESLGEIDKAKLYFREAFLWEPMMIDLSLLDSKIVKRLRDIVRAQGINEKDVVCWIPVYGTILNEFDVYRDLKPEEVDEIFRKLELLRNAYNRDKNKSTKSNIIAKMINYLLVLIDYYYHQEGDIKEAVRLADIIKLLEPNVYKKMISNAYSWLLEASIN